MKNADMPAMPQANEEVVTAFLENELDAPNGLTKREHFAAMAMQGLLASGFHQVDDTLCHEACGAADLMLSHPEDSND